MDFVIERVELYLWLVRVDILNEQYFGTFTIVFTMTCGWLEGLGAGWEMKNYFI